MKPTVVFRFTLYTILILGFTTACGFIGGSQSRVLGSDSPAPLTGDGWLACSQACRDRAQCGLAQNFEADVVLLRTDIPDTVGHNMIIGAGEPILIVGSTDIEVARISDPNSRYLARFYQVQVPDRAPAWVAGWCVEQ